MIELLHQAVAHHQAGRLAEAEEAYHRILEIDPRNVDALHFLGFIAYQRSDHARAEQLISQALALNNANRHAHHNLGRVHQAQGKLAQAVASYRATLELDPRHVDAWFHLGNAAGALGRREEARDAYRKVLELMPSHFEASYNLGIVCRELNRRDEAIAAFRRAIELRPDVAAVHYALGHALRDEDSTAEAQECFRRALACDPDHVEARWSLVMSQIPSVYAAGQDPAECRARFAEELERLPGWFDARRSARGFMAVGSDQPFALAYQEQDNRELLRRHGELCARLMAHWPERQALAPGGPGADDGRLRVGIVSAHFRDHSVWNAIVKGWFQHLDASRFALHAFYLGSGEDGETHCAKSRAVHYESGPKDLRGWVQSILDCRPQVLIYPEIGMDPMTARLASLRLAPVQAASWGHPQTTGLPNIDYYLSAQDLEPDGAQQHYTEQLVPLPRLGCYVEPPALEAVLPDFEGCRIDPGVPLLVCPGVPFKYAPQDDALLPEIARRLGGCQFLFFRHWKRGLSDRLEDRLRAAFAAAGVDYDRTVRFIPWQPRAAFYGWLQRADVYLDTVGFSGFNTALQAVECGLPIVTREGRFLRGRLASGILKRMGLEELVADSADGYAGRVARLVRDADYSERIAGRIEEGRGRLFRDLSPIRALESFLSNATGR